MLRIADEVYGCSADITTPPGVAAYAASTIPTVRGRAAIAFLRGMQQGASSGPVDGGQPGQCAY
jgi:hypothetical protein